jgi:thioredoxin reductase (NADPH)
MLDHVDKIFPKVTPEQIHRIEARGSHIREVHIGEVLVEQGDNAVPFFVVVSGELEIVRSCTATETLVSMHVLASLQEVNMIWPSDSSVYELPSRAKLSN